MELIGKSTIHPVLFYTGKVSGYILWILFILWILGIGQKQTESVLYKDYIAYSTAVIGLFLVVLSLVNLGPSTRLGLPAEDTVLKTNGLYRISRNPMYVGFNLWTLSAMIYSLNIWVIIAGLYSLVVYHLIILSEEQFLKNRFGEKYSRYLNQTRRYL